MKWCIGFCVASLVCLATLLRKYGLMATLLAYVASAFMSASMGIVMIGEDDQEEYEEDEDEDSLHNQ